MALYFLNPETQSIFDDKDKLLYKVLSFDRIMEALEKERWAFVSPTLWNDPFEKAFLEAEYKHSGKAFSLPIKPVKKSDGLNYNLFASCFTETPESEAFWKTYSPNGDGIRVTFNASDLKAKLSNLRDYDVYIGKAVYENYDKLYKFKQDANFWRKLQSQKVNSTHLELMLKKRLPFAYENEVRVLLLRKDSMTKSVAKVKISNLKNLIKAVKLDPRMGIYMSKMIKEAFSNKGFDKTVVRKSRLYSKPNSTIVFFKDLDLPISDIPITTLSYEIY